MIKYELKETKDFQEYLNNLGYELIEIIEDEPRQIRSCQAWEIKARIRDIDTGEELRIKILQSYKTIVGAYFNNMIHLWKNYSRSTSKQLTWWGRVL